MVVSHTTIDAGSGAASDFGSWHPKTTSTYDKADIITLIVGTEEHEMTAYGSYLSKSEIFQAALKKNQIA